MAREKEDFRDLLAQLNRMYPDVEVLHTAECLKILNCKDIRTVKAKVPLVRGEITKVALARALCR